MTEEGLKWVWGAMTFLGGLNTWVAHVAFLVPLLQLPSESGTAYRVSLFIEFIPLYYFIPLYHLGQSKSNTEGKVHLF